MCVCERSGGWKRKGREGKVNMKWKTMIKDKSDEDKSKYMGRGEMGRSGWRVEVFGRVSTPPTPRSGKGKGGATL